MDNFTKACTVKLGQLQTNKQRNKQTTIKWPPPPQTVKGTWVFLLLPLFFLHLPNVLSSLQISQAINIFKLNIYIFFILNQKCLNSSYKDCSLGFPVARGWSITVNQQQQVPGGKRNQPYGYWQPQNYSFVNWKPAPNTHKAPSSLQMPV